MYVCSHTHIKDNITLHYIKSHMSFKKSQDTFPSTEYMYVYIYICIYTHCVYIICMYVYIYI